MNEQWCSTATPEWIKMTVERTGDMINNYYKWNVDKLLHAAEILQSAKNKLSFNNEIHIRTYFFSSINSLPSMKTGVSGHYEFNGAKKPQPADVWDYHISLFPFSVCVLHISILHICSTYSLYCSESPRQPSITNYNLAITYKQSTLYTYSNTAIHI